MEQGRMNNSVSIFCVVGTRPEAIKMAPVILALKQTIWARVKVIATAQHRGIMDEALELFGVVPDIDLDLMRPDQQLSDLTSRLLSALDTVFRSERPDAVLAQGDTTTVFATALAAFYQRIPFCHVEAGLRTGDMRNPFPEEMNRLLTARLCSLHFAPTARARQALLSEGVDPNAVFVTGNTVIDALHSVARTKPLPELNIPSIPANKKMVLLTTHRRENFGERLTEILSAVRHLARTHCDLHFVYPVHPNPSVQRTAADVLAHEPRITLCPPLNYHHFVTLMNRAWLVLTDSGGLQEEAPALGKPVLVLRDATERPESIEAGIAKLVGHTKESIVFNVETILRDEHAYASMAKGASPYGDGHAAARITEILFERFSRG